MTLNNVICYLPIQITTLSTAKLLDLYSIPKSYVLCCNKRSINQTFNKVQHKKENLKVISSHFGIIGKTNILLFNFSGFLLLFSKYGV